nr:uncharacterized protein CI109_001385 [Kwoniella shandongensis]KAA5529983.1 hypothetical protein CI109_001385 [Kwoniella shandongensis]
MLALRPTTRLLKCVTPRSNFARACTTTKPTRQHHEPTFQIASFSSTSFTQNASPEESYLHTLSSNPELSRFDAENDLRWIISEVQEHAKRELARGKLPPIEDERVEEFVRRRAEGEPLQYILGNTDFGPLTILCKRPTLIPRPETAHIFTQLSQHILSSIPPLTSASRPSEPLSILDLCTGTGCIPLLMAHLNPLSTATGLDNSPAAVSLGGVNAKKLDMHERVDIRYGNIFGPSKRLITRPGDLGGAKKVGMVVSNPPYIPYEEWKDLPRSVREYESPAALLGDGTKGQLGKGLKFYERIAEILSDLLIEEEELAGKGWKGIPRVAVEVGKGQARDVEDILRGSNGGVVGRTEVWNDQFGVERLVVGWTR